MTTQTNGDELERKRFEAWLISMPFADVQDITRDDSGEYAYLETSWCWRAWQAALNSVDGKDDGRGDNYRK